MAGLCLPYRLSLEGVEMVMEIVGVEKMESFHSDVSEFGAHPAAFWNPPRSLRNPPRSLRNPPRSELRPYPKREGERVVDSVFSDLSGSLS